MEPKISVVVPVFNCEKYVERCINSICSQTYKNIEIIIVNDGSTDSSKKICEEMCLIDNRIKLFNIKNGGVASARNYGMEVSTGEYLMFVDSDDYIDNDMCASLFSEMQNKNVDVVVSERIDEDINGKLVYKANVKEARIEYFDSKFNFMNSDLCEVVTGVLYKISVLEGITFDNRFYVGEDSLFIFTVFSKCSKYFITDKQFYHYIIYQESASHGIIDEKKYTEILAWSEIKKIVAESNGIQYESLCAAIEYRARLLFRKSYGSKLNQIQIDELLKNIVEEGKKGRKYVAPKGRIERMLIWIFRKNYPRFARTVFEKKCH